MKTVKDLKDLLANFPEDRIVVMSGDGEGNNYSPWSGDFALCAIDEDGEVYFVEDDEDEDLAEFGTPCVVLWPV